MKTRKTIRNIIVITSIVVILSQYIFSADWPHFLGPNYNNISDETNLRKSWSVSGPKILWTADVGLGFGGAAIRDDEVFILDRIDDQNDVFRCLDLDSGAEKWRYMNPVPGRLPYPGSRGVPTVTEKFVYGISCLGNVYCIDKKSQKLVWSVDIQKEYNVEPPRFGFAQSPMIYKNMVYIAPMSESIGLVALDKKSGKELWKSEPFGYSYSTPSIIKLNGIDQLTLQVTLDRSKKKGALISFNPDTGKKLWQYDDYYVMAAIPEPIVINNDRLFHTSGYEAGSIMLKVTKKESDFSIKKLFSVSQGSQIHQPILFQEHLYLIVNENANQRIKSKRKEGGLMCMDLAGNIKWRTGDAPNFGRGSIIFADGLFIIQDGHDGRLRLVKPEPGKFQILAEHNIFNIDDKDDHQMWAPMSLSNGRLIVRSQAKMKCIDIREAN